MKLKTLKEIDVAKRRVLVRADLDVGEHFAGLERLNYLLPTLDYLVGKESEVILIGHRGRPGGREVSTLSMKPVADALEKLLKEKWGEERVKKLDMHIRENLRFDPGEEANDVHFAEHLADDGDVYINEAFATSHRKHASIVALPQEFRTRDKNSVAAGFRFADEVANLSRVLENPKRPVVVLISGIKEDKLNYLNDFQKFADKILIGGRLPEYMEKKQKDEKIFVSTLTEDKLDINEKSIDVYMKEIEKAGTIVVSGPVSKFDKEKETEGTRRILTQITQSSAFKLAGGGDTRYAIRALGLQDKFDWISVGGGAMLEYLAKGTLPGIGALIN